MMKLGNYDEMMGLSDIYTGLAIVVTRYSYAPPLLSLPSVFDAK